MAKRSGFRIYCKKCKKKHPTRQLVNDVLTIIEQESPLMNKKGLMHGSIVVTQCKILKCYTRPQAPGGS
jgi:hypothetical protein